MLDPNIITTWSILTVGDICRTTEEQSVGQVDESADNFVSASLSYDDVAILVGVKFQAKDLLLLAVLLQER